ncbi:MAG TPA: site-specific integrase [Planctomycetaceae bacterium]|nr:site-specific integrase [Planctomycetaceae bacterium]
MADDLVPVRIHQELSRCQQTAELPEIIREVGNVAQFAFEEFFHGQIRNPHTRKNYRHTLQIISAWRGQRGIELRQVAPADVGRFLDSLDVAIPTRKLRLAAVRRFFDELVLRHVLILNPALSVRERYQVIKGRTTNEQLVISSSEFNVWNLSRTGVSNSQLNTFYVFACWLGNDAMVVPETATLPRSFSAKRTPVGAMAARSCTLWTR